jgi:CRISPR system Cascade subunit CasD
VIGDDRPTLSFPTRSAVLGLLGACLGVARSDRRRLADVGDGTRVHVRVDLPGTLVVDDQTIQDNPNASSTRQTIQSKRTYLCDASFTVLVVPGPASTLRELAAALERPVFAPFLGRRTCVPSTPLLLARSVVGSDPLAAFRTLSRGPAELVDGLGRAQDDIDYYLDVDDHPDRLRRIPVRDWPTGTLPRQWRERYAVHVRRPAAELAAASP